MWFIDNAETLQGVKQHSGFNYGEKALVEQFIEGKEYSVESLSYHSKHYVVQITEKMSDGAPHFVELGHHQPAEMSNTCREKVSQAVCDILDAVGYTNGASHIELKVTKNEDIYLIDLNPRGGGDYISTHLVQLSTNCDYTKEIIDIALNRFDESHYPYSHKAYSGVYFLTQQTKRLLPYFEKDIPEVIEKEYNKNITASCNNNDRNGYMIYQGSKKLVL